jgi:hypothetical protein
LSLSCLSHSSMSCSACPVLASLSWLYSPCTLYIDAPARKEIGRRKYDYESNKLEKLGAREREILSPKKSAKGTCEGVPHGSAKAQAHSSKKARASFGLVMKNLCHCPVCPSQV